MTNHEKTLEQALHSFAVVPEAKDYRQPYAKLLPNVLLQLDLPDCEKASGQRTLKQNDPCGTHDALS